MTQFMVNVFVITALAVSVLIMSIMNRVFSVSYDKSVRLRQYKLSDTDCTLEQAVSDVCIINNMSECGYGLSQSSKCNKHNRDLEDFGVMTSEFDKNAPSYNARALSEYCKKKGITTEDLTEEELNLLRDK